MIESKHMYIMFIVAVIVIVIILATRKKSEGFVGLDNLTYKVERVEASSGEEAEKGSFYSVPGTYQGILSPRFSNLDYGAHLRSNMPSYEHQGSPKDPLFQSGNPYLTENFDGNYKVPMMSQDVPTLYDPQHQQQNSQHSNALSYGVELDGGHNVHSGIPVRALNADGQEESTAGDDQPIVYDRLIYANKKNRNLAAADVIRGDLPIVPDQGGWFRPSVTPHLDLKQGAMTIIGGQGNETSHALSRLIYDSSAGKQNSTFSGIATTQMSTSRSSRGHDLQVTAFP